MLWILNPPFEGDLSLFEGLKTETGEGRGLSPTTKLSLGHRYFDDVPFGRVAVSGDQSVPKIQDPFVQSYEHLKCLLIAVAVASGCSK